MNDEPCATEENLLLTATDISFSEVYDLVHGYGGIMIPSHVECPANSMVATLGIIPPDSQFTCFEIKNINMLHGTRKANPYLEKCRVIVDSDAHYLEAINEPVYSVSVSEKTPQCILRTLEDNSSLL